MVVYRDQRKGSLKWLLAIIIFVLALTITFSDAYGIHIPPGHVAFYQPGTTTTTVIKHHLYDSGDLFSIRPTESGARGDKTIHSTPPSRPFNGPEDNPLTIPEPATLLLVGTGLAALYGLRKKNIL